MDTEGLIGVRTESRPLIMEENCSEQGQNGCAKIMEWPAALQRQWLGRAGPQQKWSAMQWPNDFTGIGARVWSVVASSASTCCWTERGSQD